MFYVRFFYINITRGNKKIIVSDCGCVFDRRDGKSIVKWECHLDFIQSWPLFSRVGSLSEWGDTTLKGGKPSLHRYGLPHKALVKVKDNEVIKREYRRKFRWAKNEINNKHTENPCRIHRIKPAPTILVNKTKVWWERHVVLPDGHPSKYRPR